MLSRALMKSFSYGNPLVAVFIGNYCSRVRFHQHAVRKVALQAECGFTPEKVAIVTKTTRYEFEQQRYRYAGLSEEDIKQLVSRHLLRVEYLKVCLDTPVNLVRPVMHSRCYKAMFAFKTQLCRLGFVYNNQKHIFQSFSHNGTFMKKADKIYDKNKPVLGVNTDPERSEGHLCLPVHYTHAFSEALQKLRKGEFRWQWRQRIRMHLEGTGINPTPVDLHELQLSLEQHSKAHRITTETQRGMSHDSTSGPHLLPVRGLNEIFIGESLSSRASYYEISIDDGPWDKQKSSGLSICTGTGSKAWSYNINKLVEQAVEDVLRIGKSKTGLNLPLNREFIESVTAAYNESLIFSPEENKLFFSIREPIVNRVFSSSKQRGFANKVCVRSRCWDACMVVDGGTSFEFNDGAIATICLNEEDLLRTVILD
ncbi:NAD kinase 2, mitochondrial [Triplophysa tibetana]|uniref:NAD kinase 2, mitochondrial n=1 Tax=Triplophysa tibetana TaxID=1572043 RepID=A0A5A9PDH1_9TELE|nr:NAD kinase 2, mitochondrial [Triplophysa tibetana]